MGRAFEVGDVAADAEQDAACGPDAYPGHRRRDREKRVVLQELPDLAPDLAPPVLDGLDVAGDGGDDGLGHAGAGQVGDRDPHVPRHRQGQGADGVGLVHDQQYAAAPGEVFQHRADGLLVLSHRLVVQGGAVPVEGVRVMPNASNECSTCSASRVRFPGRARPTTTRWSNPPTG